MGQTFRKQATPFTQTERNGWVLTLTAQETTELLPKREPEQLSLFTETNRPVTGRHMESIERFLSETPGWALPSIILAVTPGSVAREEGAISVDTDQIRVLDAPAPHRSPLQPHPPLANRSAPGRHQRDPGTSGRHPRPRAARSHLRGQGQPGPAAALRLVRQEQAHRTRSPGVLRRVRPVQQSSERPQWTSRHCSGTA